MATTIRFEMVPAPLQESLEWLLQVEEFQAARGLARAIAKRLPQDSPMTSDFLGYALYKAKFYREAAEQALRTVELLPDSPDAMFNAAKSLNSAGEPARSETLIRNALRLRPGWLDARIELAVYVSMQGRHDEAMKLLQDVERALPPGSKDLDVVRFNLGWHLVRKGRFNEGMKGLAIGRKLKIWGAMTHQYEKPMLAPGTDLRGKTVLACGEGGVGDEIINTRFAQIIEKRGGKCIWVTRKPLKPVLERATAVSGVILENAPRPHYDYWAPAMDLPVLLDLELSDVPNQPYLRPDESYVSKWRARLGPKPAGKIRVGIRWQGNALYEQDLMRSVPFKLLETLCELPNVELYSLQRDEGSEERPADSPVIDLGPELVTWEDTAGAISNLDLIVSSCTSVPHLAAAMGRPTWVLCPLNCYYLWATPGETSPWYPSIRLFRQETIREWEKPVARVADALRSLR